MSTSKPKNPTEFVGLWSLHARRVHAYILTLVYNLADAEDIFQETSATLWEKFDEFEPGTDFGAWAVKIAYFKVRNWMQKRRPLELVDETLLDLLAQESLALDDMLDARFEALSKCLAKLSVSDRRLIEARYHANLTVKQMAVQVGSSVYHVYRVLRQIHDRLFECIQRRVAGAEK